MPAGTVVWAEHSPTPPPFIKPRKYRGRRAAGVSYEKKLHRYLLDVYGDSYLPSPWFRFREIDSNRIRWCQPDGLVFAPYSGQITIVEAKLQHTSDAWWQLKMLYLPVLAKVFPPELWGFAMVEVVKWFDPATSFPERIKMRESLSALKNGEVGIHIWKP